MALHQPHAAAQMPVEGIGRGERLRKGSQIELRPIIEVFTFKGQLGLFTKTMTCRRSVTLALP
jgi:hypothetical protein